MWTILYVIAGTKKEFNDFVLRSVESDRYRDTNFCWVGHSDVFKGQVNPNGICIGTWKDRPDITDILFQLQVACKDKTKFCRAMDLGQLVADYRKNNTPKPYDHTQWSIDNFGSSNGA